MIKKLFRIEIINYKSYKTKSNNQKNRLMKKMKQLNCQKQEQQREFKNSQNWKQNTRNKWKMIKKDITIQKENIIN